MGFHLLCLLENATALATHPHRGISVYQMAHCFDEAPGSYNFGPA